MAMVETSDKATDRSAADGANSNCSECREEEGRLATVQVK
jgi:hypothetical protein